MTTATATSPALPWNPDLLTAPTTDAVELVGSGVRLRVSASQTVHSRLTELKLTEYYTSSIEVYVETQRPISSDYDPFVTGTISLVVAGREMGTNAVKVTRTVLANISSDKYPTREEETRVRDAATALIESDTLLARWWHSMMTPTIITKADANATEQARTDAILALVEEARQEVETRRHENPRKGASLKVVKGRKVPIGTTGKLFWVGTTQFGKRVGFKDATDATHWVAWGNIEFTDPIDEQEVLILAKEKYRLRFANVFGPARN